jgi:hypothetical protein
MHTPSFLLRLHTARSTKNLVARVGALVLAIGISAPAAADEVLTAIGGPGGGRFEAHCPPGQVLTGLDLRAGDDVDAIRPLCAAATGPRDVGASAAEGTWYGGNGGGPARVECNRYSPVIHGMFVAYEGEKTVVVNNIHLYCGEATNTEAPSDAATAMFDAPGITSSGLFISFHQADERMQRCAPGQVAVGLHGRSGIWVDAIGLICGPSGVAVAAPSAPTSAVTSIGRVKTKGPASPPRPICDAARDARARNSPAAASLEAQCKATLSAQSPTVIVPRVPDSASATSDAARLNPQPLPPQSSKLVPESRVPKKKLPPPVTPATVPADRGQ